MIVVFFFSKILSQIPFRDTYPLFSRLQNLLGRLSAKLPNGSLQGTDTGLFRVIADDFPQCSIRNTEKSTFQPVTLQLFLHQMLFRNVHLFIFRIAGDRNHFHSVKKRSWNRLKGVGGCHKDNFREIQRYFQIMIPEFFILFRIQNLQKCGKGITFIIISAHLVNLVQKHHGIFDPRFPKPIRDSSRHRSYIGLSVSPDLRLISDTSERDSYIRLFHGLRKGFRNGCFSSSRRSHKTQNRRSAEFCQFSDRQIFKHPFFDFFQTIMLCLKNLLGMFHIGIFLRPFIPGHLQHCLKIGTDDSCLGRVVYCIFKPAYFFCHFLVYFLRSLHFLFCFFEFFRVGQCSVLSQLFTDIF